MNSLALYLGLSFILQVYLVIGLLWLRCNPEVVRIIRRTANNDIVLVIASMAMAILWPIWSIYIGVAYIRGMLRIAHKRKTK